MCEWNVLDGEWKHHREGAAHAEHALDPEPTAVRFDDQSTAIEAEATARDLPDRGGAVVLFKEMRQILRRDAEPLVHHSNDRSGGALIDPYQDRVPARR